MKENYAPTCLRKRPNIRYMAISAHEVAFPVASLGILATLMPWVVAALMSTPLAKGNKWTNQHKTDNTQFDKVNTPTDKIVNVSKYKTHKLLIKTITNLPAQLHTAL